MNNVLKFLLLAAGCAIVVLFITMGANIAKKSQEDTDGNLGQYTKTAGDYEDVDLISLDGTTVLGKSIKNLIQEYDDDPYLSIVVHTNRGVSTAYVNACVVTGLTVTTNSGIEYSAIPSAKTNANYINDSGKFTATVHYDANDVIGCVWFDQQ